MSSDDRGGAVVTGAASGIGRAIAAGLLADGFSVVIADLDEVKGASGCKGDCRCQWRQRDFPSRRCNGQNHRPRRHRRLRKAIRLDQGDGQQCGFQQAGAVPRSFRSNLAQDHGCECPRRHDRHPGSWQGDDRGRRQGQDHQYGFHRGPVRLCRFCTLLRQQIRGRCPYPGRCPGSREQGHYGERFCPRRRRHAAVDSTGQGSHGDGRQLGTRRSLGELRELDSARSSSPSPAISWERSVSWRPPPPTT